jgi:ribosomal-protein-alanine N-acetyltransferase
MLSNIALALNTVIQTPRLALEPMGERHADAFFGPLQDDSLYQWISMEKPPSVEWLRRHWRAIESRMSPDGKRAWATWAVRCMANGMYIGRVDAEINSTLEAPNFGYYFFPQHWGHGYATESVAAATQQLIALGVDRLVATVTVGNMASARVLQKAGFQFTRILAGNDVIRGVVVDDEEYVKSASQ